MFSPTIAQYELSQLAYSLQANKDIIVCNYYVPKEGSVDLIYIEDDGVWEDSILKQYPNAIPAFELDPLHRWTREIKNLSVIVDLNTSAGYYYKVYKTIDSYIEPELVTEGKEHFGIYTDALQAGLIKTLKLINNG